MSTESIARQVIAASESAPTVSADDRAAAHEVADSVPWLEAEARHHAADDADSFTRRAASVATTLADSRPFVSTKQGMVRRQFDDDGNATRRVAREAIDAAEWFSDVDPTQVAKDKRAMQLHEFAKATNASTMGATLPSGGDVFEPGSDEWRQSADAVIDQIIQRGRANQ